MHPLDQFRAFLALREKGKSEEDIAAAYFIGVNVVKQRLRLVTVSEKLLDVYAEDGLSLEQLMAFTVTSDHARQEQVWASLEKSWSKEPYQIRRMLTEKTVRASDKRAVFVGLDAYETAGGSILRDLFQQDDGGWLENVGLLDRLVTEKLKVEAETIAAEGWKWIEVATDFPYGHAHGLRRLEGVLVNLTVEEQATIDALNAEQAKLQAEYEAADELPDGVDERLGEIETALAAFENRPSIYDPAEIVRAGVFVSIDAEGGLSVDRGYVRPQDEAPVEADNLTDPDAETLPQTGTVQRAVISIGGTPAGEPETAEDDDVLRPLSDRLVTELTAHRTLALRDRLANEPQIAFQAVLHALCLSAFYRHGSDTCLEITAKHSGFSAQAPGLADTAPAKAIDARHAQWAKQMPEEPADLWNALTGFDGDSQAALFAHCASLTVNVVKEPWARRPGAMAHGDDLARAVSLDMAAAGWAPTVETYLGRVPKVRILEAVREAKGESSAQLIDHLKKAEMAKEAERLLEGSGWLPEPLRLVDPESIAEPVSGDSEADALPEFLAGDDDDASIEEADEPHSDAAE